MKNIFYKLILFFVAFIWGAQYILYKQIPDEISSTLFLMLTNIIGVIATIAIKPKTALTIKKNELIEGFLLGLLLMFFNIALLNGTRMISASNASFLASLYIVMIPLLMLFGRKKISKIQALAIFIVMSGIYLGTGADFTNMFNEAFWWLLLANLIFAIYMLFVEKYTHKSGPMSLSLVQLVTISVCCVPILLISSEPVVFVWTQEFIVVLLLAGIFVKSISTILQIYAQAKIDATHSSVILSTEIIFTVVSVTFLPKLIGGENQPITALMIAGCIILFVGVLVSNFKPKDTSV